VITLRENAERLRATGRVDEAEEFDRKAQGIDDRADTVSQRTTRACTPPTCRVFGCLAHMRAGRRRAGSAAQTWRVLRALLAFAVRVWE
jgi:hypothetical protein